MKAIYIHSIYCPKCTIFRFGRLIRFGKDITDIHGDNPEISGLSIVKQVCNGGGIPYSEIDVGNNYETISTKYFVKGRIINRFLSMNKNRTWVSEKINKDTIELPGFLIDSSIAKSRYISIEIITEPPRDKPEELLINQWSAARQILRSLARTAVEEKLNVWYGNSDYDTVEYILNKLFPMDEEGKIPDIYKWIHGFISLRNMRMIS